MKPVAIFRHAASEGPGFLADFLERRAIPWRLVRIDAGDPVPASAEAFSGLAFMGGPMSVNDDLPWIAPVLALIRGAVASDIPVLGHCLGGQLMAKAMGAAIGSNPVKEIGWGELHVSRSDTARHWFGPRERFLGFHWHGETFGLPAGATRLLASAHCANQAFVVGKHLGFQCHVEMTAAMVREWCAIGAEELAASASSAGVQTAQQMQEDLDARVAVLNGVAEVVYGRWTEGLRAD